MLAGKKVRAGRGVKIVATAVAAAAFGIAGAGIAHADADVNGFGHSPSAANEDAAAQCRARGYNSYKASDPVRYLDPVSGATKYGVFARCYNR